MASFKEQQSTEKFEKRRIPRFPVQLPAQLDDKDDLSSICTDLSSQGLSMETSLPVNIGQKVSVKVMIAPSEQPLRMFGQVIWKKESIALDTTEHEIVEIGVRFIKPIPNPWKQPGNSDFLENSFEEEDLYGDEVPFEEGF